MDFTIFVSIALGLFSLLLSVAFLLSLRALDREIVADDKGTLRQQILVPENQEFAFSAAEARRAFLRRALSDHSDLNPPGLEIIEVPEGWETESLSFRELPRNEALAQLSALRWQQEKPEYLLLGRLSDAIAVIAKRAGLTCGQLASSVRIEPLLIRPAEPQLGRRTFPFIGIVETDFPQLIRQNLEGMQAWFGFDIATEPRREATAFFRCTVDGGEEGQAGGALICNGVEIFVLTCSHVLTRDCGSVKYRCKLQTETYEPDYALLHAGSPCFHPVMGEPVECAGDPEAFRDRKKPVVLSHRVSKEGVIRSIHSWVEYSGRTHKFPHVTVRRPFRVILDLFAWPLWGRVFSVPGESGSWVISRDRTLWYGLLVAGNRYRRISYAALAAPLSSFLLSVASSDLPSSGRVQFRVQRQEIT